MTPALGWVQYEKRLRAEDTSGSTPAGETVEIETRNGSAS
jgi:hypothetical protein